MALICFGDWDGAVVVAGVPLASFHPGGCNFDSAHIGIFPRCAGLKLQQLTLAVCGLIAGCVPIARKRPALAGGNFAGPRHHKAPTRLAFGGVANSLDVQ